MQGATTPGPAYYDTVPATRSTKKRMPAGASGFLDFPYGSSFGGNIIPPKKTKFRELPSEVLFSIVFWPQGIVYYSRRRCHLALPGELQANHVDCKMHSIISITSHQPTLGHLRDTLVQHIFLLWPPNGNFNPSPIPSQGINVLAEL